MMYSPFKYLSYLFWKRRAIQLTFFITKRCNAKCPFCFYISPSTPSFTKRGSEEELKIDEIERISSTFGNLLWLAFSGGEIFLRDDIIEISKIFYKNNKPSIILYPTNGLTPELIYERMDKILRYCKKSSVVVKLSLDGLNKLHDELRGINGSFEKVMESYNLLSRLLDRYPNFDLGINTVFCSLNQDCMGEIIRFVNTLDRINTHTVSLVRGEIDKVYKDVDMGKYRDTINTMEVNLKKKIAGIYRFRGAKIKAAQDILQRRLIYQTEIERKRLIPCYAGRLNLVMTETGDIYPCESFKMKMGNLRDCNYDISALLRTEEAKRIIHSIQNGVCYCSHECYLMTNILFNPRLYPDLVKGYLQI